MATKFGIRNYSRSGNTVTFTVVALNANGTVDTNFTGSFTFAGSNATFPGSYTFVAGDQGQRVFTATITNPNNFASVVAQFPGSFSGNAVLGLAGSIGNDSVSTGVNGDHIWVGNVGNDNYTSGAGNDLFRLEQGGVDTANGGAGDDGFYFGGAYTSADVVNGGDGFRDTIGLQGNYAAGATTLGSMVGTEIVALLAGNDTRFGDTAGNFYDYLITADGSTVVSNNRLTIQANTLRAGEDFTFIGLGSSIDFLIYGGFGTENLTGGSGNDGFLFGQGRFGATDVVNGGTGAFDTLGLQGNFALTFGAGQLTSIDIIALLSASDNRFGASGGTVSYNLTTVNQNLASGQTMIISGNTLQAGEILFFNGRAELDGSFNIYSGAGNDSLSGSQNADIIFGGAGNDRVDGENGADQLTGGAGNDEFLYARLDESTPDGRDHILDFTLGDRVALDVLAANTGDGSDFRFIGGTNQNGARQLQVIQNGTAATVNVFIDGDNIADLVIDVTVADGHTLTVSDFVGAVPNSGGAPATTAMLFGSETFLDQWRPTVDSWANDFASGGRELHISPTNDFNL